MTRYLSTGAFAVCVWPDDEGRISAVMRGSGLADIGGER